MQAVDGDHCVCAAFVERKCLIPWITTASPESRSQSWVLLGGIPQGSTLGPFCMYVPTKSAYFNAFICINHPVKLEPQYQVYLLNRSNMYHQQTAVNNHAVLLKACH